jgi:hypothetical protein
MSNPTAELGRIRRGLNPAFSYIILERQGSPGRKDDLDGLLSRLSIPVLETRIYENATSGRLFFVAKLDPEKAGEISKEYVSVNLPENVTCLFYGRLVFEAGRGEGGNHKGIQKHRSNKKPGEEASYEKG